jgi:hypothetical protein
MERVCSCFAPYSILMWSVRDLVWGRFHLAPSGLTVPHLSRCSLTLHYCTGQDDDDDDEDAPAEDAGNKRKASSGGEGQKSKQAKQ